MKFCAYLNAVNEDAPEALRGKFINYKRVKKFLKYRARRVELASRGIPLNADAFELRRGSQQEVAELLQEQLRLVDQ